MVPSLWYENSPLVIQEAFGVGTPVVASRLGALTEKVEDGRTGRLFTAGDVGALAAVLGDIAAAPGCLREMSRMIRPAPVMAEHAARLLKIYAQIHADAPNTTLR